jgi:hypothetical protein
MKPMDETQKLTSKIFGPSEVQNRIGMSAVKLILSDIVTLYNEFKEASGAGALFFNPWKPDLSQYLTLKDIQTDIVLAEELMDNKLKAFLQKIQKVATKEADSSNAVVVLITEESMSIHVLNLDSADEKLQEKANAFKFN